MAPVSAIKLIRTDTTLDLSQKAEKGMKSVCTALWGKRIERPVLGSAGTRTPRGAVWCKLERSNVAQWIMN
jgi:hypothetical protein